MWCECNIRASSSSLIMFVGMNNGSGRGKGKKIVFKSLLFPINIHENQMKTQESFKNEHKRSWKDKVEVNSRNTSGE